MSDREREGLVLGDPPVHLRQPVLLVGLGGWGDAGGAATIAVRHVLGEQPPAASAMLNPSACYDFTVARPQTSRRPPEQGGGWILEYPKAAFHPMLLPEAERDLLVLAGPEPHFRWPELAPAVVSYARAAGVGLVVTLGAYVGPVTHRRAPVVRRTLTPSLEARLDELKLGDTGYEGPTTFATALLHAASAADVPSVSLWVATPPYLQAGNPVAALAVLEAAQKLTDLPLQGLPQLREAAGSFLRDVEAALEEHPELAEQLKEMLEAEGMNADEQTGASPSTWTDPDPDRPPPGTPLELPTGKALVEAVEKYLRQGRDEDAPRSGL